MKSLIILSFFFLNSIAFSSVLNRNILDIDGHVYTQRDFELYLMAKEAVFYRPKVQPINLKADNWAVQLEAFKNEMLINGLFDRESQRLVNFIPNSDMVTATMKLVRRSLKRSRSLQGSGAKLKARNDELQTQVIILLKVQAYLKSKANKVERGAWRYQVDVETLWFSRIKKAIPFRFFEGAKLYQSIVSLP